MKLVLFSNMKWHTGGIQKSAKKRTQSEGSLTNCSTKANSAFHPSGVGKWVPASAEKAKAGMVHSVSGWTRGVQVKLWDHLRTRAIPERLDKALHKSTFTLTLPLPPHKRTLQRPHIFARAERSPGSWIIPTVSVVARYGVHYGRINSQLSRNAIFLLFSISYHW